MRAMLTVLAATAEGLDGDRALALLTGPIGRVDPVSLRQLRRTLTRGKPADVAGDFGDVLVAALGAGAPTSGSRLLQRIRGVLDAAARCHRDGQDPRYTLWAAWHRSGLQRRWLAASERGGSAATQATRDLEAVTALFDVTDQYVSRTPGRHCAVCSSTSRRCSCRASRPSPRRRPSRSRCSAPTPPWGTNGTCWSSPACRMGCGPTPFRAVVCWPRSGCSTSWTVSAPTPRCARRCWPRSAGCWWPRWAGPGVDCW